MTYLEEAHFGNINMCARKAGTWENRHAPADVIINATGLGTSTSESPYEELPEGVRLVIDLAIKTNNLEKQCLDKNVKYVSGREFYREQFLKQFKIYTGIEPDRQVFNNIERKLYETI
jgi:shikimate 5-dehydrogenase